MLSVTGAALLLWELVTFVKSSVIGKLDVNTWVYIFFHPSESSLFNYVIVAAFLGACALCLYDGRLTRYARNKSDSIGYPLLVTLPILSLFGLGTSVVFSTNLRSAVYALISVVPLVFFLTPSSKPDRPALAGLLSRILLPCSYLILFALLLEPCFLMRGPVYLMNEYQDLYGETLIGKRYVNNREFLGQLHEDPYDFTSFQDLRNQYKTTKSRSSFLAFLKREDLASFEAYRDLDRKVNEPSTFESGEKRGDNPTVGNPNIDIEDIKCFYLNNQLEYKYQNMARGQINHIGHILNPLNEYMLGRPLDQSYLQYGIGNTFLMKWVMDLSGGLSLQGYYKCYIFYLIYAALFFIMLKMLFKGDRLFVLGSFSVYGLAFFLTGFMGFVLAPGIIPSGHMFDVVVFILLVLFFLRKSLIFLGLAALASTLGLVLSFQFGTILSMAFIFTSGLFIFENFRKKGSCPAIAIIVAMLALDVALLRLLPAGKSAHDFHYFLLGYFSWEPKRVIVILTVFYLVVSYTFMLLLRSHREPVKYLYTFSFMYSQGLLVYFYWSGLPNHLPLVLPFLGLQLFFMLFVMYNVFFREREEAREKLRMWVAALTAVSFLLMLVAAVSYYTYKQEFYSNFTDHRVYRWQFPRAKVITTINPSSVAEAISLMNKCTEADNGVFIISRYDNLLPFLARKYSRMPHFQLPYALVSREDTAAAVESIEKNCARFLFVDTDIDLAYEPFDPWNKLFLDEFVRKERASRYGRLVELKKVFDGVRNSYRRIAKGKLVSVYERIN
jgi:hypothetical protein